MENSKKAVIYWLYFCAFSVVVMMFIGALTRLTESGLSIAVWEPFKGALPPLSQDEWQKYFDVYKQTSEFKKVNNWMKIDQFKGIFWLEYIHRLWGRLIGMILLLPLIYFYLRGKIDRKLAVRVFLIFCLGGLQGVMGWVMVKSGLQKDALNVSHYRLAAHLLIAAVIYSLIIWTAFSLKNPAPSHGSKLVTFNKILLGMVFFMLMLGAFVAGKDAGFAYNTFPLMDGKIVPNGLYSMQPWWINHFENNIMIQFQHRIFAYLITITVITFAICMVKKSAANINNAMLLICALMLQISLGISTLLSFGTYYDMDTEYAYHKVLDKAVMLGATHQFGAVILLTVVLKCLHSLQRR